jgi:hypothetical protein
VSSGAVRGGDLEENTKLNKGISMKQVTCLFALSTLLAVCPGTALADKTNLVQEVSIQLAGLTQGGTTTNRNNNVITSTDVVSVGSRQVIAAIGAAYGNTFSRAAKLVAVTPVDGGNTAFQIRDGTNTFGVTDLFEYSQSSGTVSSSVTSGRSGRVSSSEYSVRSLKLQSYGAIEPSLTFSVQGIAVESSTAAAGAAAVSETSIDVSGSGTKSGALVILQGSIRIRGNTLEVVSDPVVVYN